MAEMESSSPLRRWLVFGAMSLAFFIVTGGTFSSLGVLLPTMVQELKWNWAEAGLGYTLLGASCGLASLFPAFAIRTLGVRGTLLIGTVILVAGFACLALDRSVALFWVATTLIGIGFAFLSVVPGTHILTDLFGNRPAILGVYFTLGALGGVAGPQIYQLTDSLFHDWRVYWWAFAVMGAISGLLAVMAVPAHQIHPEAQSNNAPVTPVGIVKGLGEWNVKQALATPQFYLIVGGYTSFLLVNTTTHGFAVQHLIERGVSQVNAGLMLSLEAFIGATVTLIGGFIGEKVSAKTLMIISLGAVTIGTWGLAEATSWNYMILYIFGVGIGYGLSLLSSTLLLLNYFGKKANLELFSIMCMLSTTAALGPFFGGWMRDVTGSFYGLLVIHAAITLFLFVCTLFLRRPTLIGSGGFSDEKALSKDA
ncbi:MFS transporter [Asticcacaulis sp. EMRT-3]|uniref:MFS transporter n=1 Tax=Asticcacaulis sp. EMRT-3 TaxID=3040349 RepID=UPI0024AEA728|nr:MFS transporter [Asticcacaulis sp. EMRT-3]MDI7773889.1 MFS transporter [Asticcacaulis sp. EMRT-3]